MKRILITGSRDWTDWGAIHDAIWRAITVDGEQLHCPVVVTGGARGADQIAEAIAHELGLEVETHLVAWRPYGIYNPHAGKARNHTMVDLGADLCLAFIKNGSPGASHCAAAAEAAGIPTRRFEA
jgi:nucleoside-diphosphate-sugar epimerase